MRTLVVVLCLLAVVYCQTQNKNGNPTGEIGQPAFDEIVVASTLTVRGKSGSRSGKSLVTDPKLQTPENKKEETRTSDLSRVELTRGKRQLEPSRAFYRNILTPMAFKDQLQKALHNPAFFQAD